MSFDNEKLDNELLELKDEDIYKYNDSEINYKDYEVNNWRPSNDNYILSAIESLGGALWVNPEGAFCFRHQVGENIVEIDQPSKLERLLTIYLKRHMPVKLFKYSKDTPPDIYYEDLKIVKEEFTPFASSEFYYKNNIWCRTSFVPSKYLQSEIKNKAVLWEDMPNISFLLENLVERKSDRLKWVINWLAGFFQTLKRSRVSLVLRGDQGSGKGLFFTEIISKLFGDNYSITVSDENLESDFKSWVDEKLFYNLNEIAVDMKSRRNIKNFLKQLVTDEYVNVQSKFKDFKKVTLYGNILITSNEAFPIEVEISDRRFTVFQTGKSLKSQDVDTNILVAGIRNELLLFTDYLKNYEVDWQLYHTALDTPEKQAIVDGTTSSMRRYIHAIINRDLAYFDELNNDNEEDIEVYNLLEEAFTKRKISRGVLYKAFERMYESKKTQKKFALELRNLEPSVFGKDRLRRSGNSIYYEI